jgi:DNA-binding LacI/PurR family transcriptional regulator
MYAHTLDEKWMNNAAQPKTAVRQSDLAEMFGVTQVTVSRALRRTGQVAPALEAAILAAAHKNGYSHEAQFHARALSRRRHGKATATNVICAMVNDNAARENEFNLLVLRGIERGAAETGNELLFAPGEHADQLPRVVARCQVDGVVWLLSEEHFRAHDPVCPVPLVTLLFSTNHADLVAINDHDAMAAMGAHLAGRGHRRVAFVGPDSVLARSRLAGLRDGLKAAGGVVADADVQMARYAMLRETVLPLVRALMKRRQACPPAERVTGIAVYNDFMAKSVIDCLREEYGLRVPEDLSVTGFDAVDWPDGQTPRLTTVAVPTEELGAEAARMIAWRLRHPHAPMRRVILDAPLVEGESVARVAW